MRVGIQCGKTCFGDRSEDGLNEVGRMYATDLFEGCTGGVFAHEILERFVFERAQDCPQPVAALGVTRGRFMIQAGRMCKQDSGHGGVPLVP